MIQVLIRKLHPNAVVPVRQTEGAAGYDLTCCMETDILLPLGLVVFVPTGLILAIPVGFEGQIRPRSGFSTKNRIIMPNAPGTIDSDYRGEIFIPLLNLGDEDFLLASGTRIAQILIKRYELVHFNQVEAIGETERGHDGFGSTGK